MEPFRLILIEVAGPAFVFYYDIQDETFSRPQRYFAFVFYYDIQHETFSRMQRYLEENIPVIEAAFHISRA